MLFQVVTENGVKKIKPLTADAGAGNPVGSYLYLEKKSNPSGYLYCDGSTFDETVYPLLYAYLGSNVLPDWREFSAVGAEQNTTNVYDAQTNPNGVIHDHDVYTEGQAKDDQLQQHQHKIQWANPNTSTNNAFVLGNGTNVTQVLDIYQGNARVGVVTRGKRKAVYIYIKATSGLSENAQDNVINTLNEERSYSTSEVNTGKKWIDGKTIYRRVFTETMGIGDKLITIPSGISVINFSGTITNSNGIIFPIPYFTLSGGVYYGIYVYIQNTNITIIPLDSGQSYYDGGTVNIILEYTKTT